MWQKFELLVQQKWMISLDNDNQLTKIEEIAPEMEMIKKLAGCESNDTKIYFKFNERIQNKIQCEIEYGLEDNNYWEHYTTNPHPAQSLVDLSVDGICCDFFGINLGAQLMIWNELNGKGILRVWDTTPTMINDMTVKTFPACIVSLPSTNVKIIEDTQRLLTGTCIPNGVALGRGYCRNQMEEHKVKIPHALIEMIIIIMKNCWK